MLLAVAVAVAVAAAAAAGPAPTLESWLASVGAADAATALGPGFAASFDAAAAAGDSGPGAWRLLDAAVLKAAGLPMKLRKRLAKAAEFEAQSCVAAAAMSGGGGSRGGSGSSLGGGGLHELPQRLHRREGMAVGHRQQWRLDGAAPQCYPPTPLLTQTSADPSALRVLPLS